MQLFSSDACLGGFAFCNSAGPSIYIVVRLATCHAQFSASARSKQQVGIANGYV